MKTPSRTKSLALAIGFCCILSCARADNILVNGNFADGKAHWKGDGKDAGSTDMTDVSAPMSSQGTAHGMIVQLKDNKWTSVSQVFNTREPAVTFSITYTTSSDFSLTPRPPMKEFDLYWVDYLIQDLVGFHLKNATTKKAESNSAIAIVSDPSQNLVIYSFVKLSNAPNVTQTSTTQINSLMPHEEKVLFVAFPEGYGSITLSEVSLTKPRTTTATPDNPFGQ